MEIRNTKEKKQGNGEAGPVNLYKIGAPEREEKRRGALKK